MPFNARFRKPKNELEEGGRPAEDRVESEADEKQKCPVCGTTDRSSDLAENLYVCRCEYCYRLTARQRIGYLTDEHSFRELFSDIESTDPIGFPGYDEKLEQSREASREPEAVLCGVAAICGEVCALFVMEPNFMMGSMGAAVGEKITKLFE